MSDNGIRTNLILHLHCAECGSVLNLVYPKDVQAKTETHGSYGAGHTDEPTGAAVRYIEPVHVQPCRACIEKYTGPAKQLASAIKAITA